MRKHRKPPAVAAVLTAIVFLIVVLPAGISADITRHKPEDLPLVIKPLPEPPPEKKKRVEEPPRVKEAPPPRPAKAEIPTEKSWLARNGWKIAGGLLLVGGVAAAAVVLADDDKEKTGSAVVSW